MAKIDVVGVAHIDSETEKAREYLEGIIGKETLVFLEPTVEMMLDPSDIVIYQRNFWTALRNLGVDKGNSVVPISHERMPRRNPNSYVYHSIGMPEPRYGVALILEEQLQAEWIHRKASESGIGVVMVGNDHAKDISQYLGAKGNEVSYHSLMNGEVPESRFNREVKEFVEGKRQDCVRSSWQQRANDFLIKQVTEYFRRENVLVIGDAFAAIASNPRMAEAYFRFCSDLLSSPELEPMQNEKLYQGCSMSLDTHRKAIEEFSIKPIRNLALPTLTKADFYKT